MQSNQYTPLAYGNIDALYTVKLPIKVMPFNLGRILKLVSVDNSDMLTPIYCSNKWYTISNTP